ncbi:MAG: peptidase U32 family protein, partial [Oscillospiraceae bacterium]
MEPTVRPAGRPIEILAPAGDEEMLCAAVFSGADCVYLGIDGFNARRTAANFGGQALARAVAFCHARNCKVYAAVNTLVFPGEEEAAQRAVWQAAAAGCDAVIVQDLYTAVLVKKLAPGVALHGSTQMSVHSLAGVQMLESLCFDRVILARELAVTEIEQIAAHTKTELEVFVHGALCVCVSGQCSMSAFLGGRSANRGACAGPCRLPFAAQSGCLPSGRRAAPEQERHHLSLRDLSVLQELPRLGRLGIASAKIEGRLRGPEYCAVVVDSARKILNGEQYDEKLLQNVFSRSGFTQGWYTGEKGKEMFGVRTKADTEASKLAQPRARELYRREAPRVGVEFALRVTPEKAVLTVQSGESSAQSEAAGPFGPAQNPQPEELLRAALAKTGGTPCYAVGCTLETGGVFGPGPVLTAQR